MSQKNAFLFCLLLMLLAMAGMPGQVFAQQYSAITYGTEEGLGASKVYTFYQDSQGYLWVSTTAGLSRFDGKTFKNFTLKDGLSSYQISSIHEDTNGGLWFKSLQWDNSRLLRFNGRKFYALDSAKVFGTGSIYFHRDQIEPLWVEEQKDRVNMIHPHQSFTLLNSAVLKDNYIYDVWIADSATAYLGTQLGLLAYRNGIYQNLSKQIGSTMQVYQINYYKGAWWLQTDEGIWQFNGKRFDNSIIPAELQKNITQMMMPDSKGNLWFGTVRGLYKYDGDCFKRFTTADGMITNRIANLMIDSNDNLWLVSESGLMVFKEGRFIALDNETAGFLGPGKGFRLRHIMEDREGNVWVTTENGITRYSGFAFLHYRYGTELEGKNANALLLDSKNRLWVGYQEGGLSLCQNGNCQQFTPKNGLSGNSVYDLLEDRKGNIWIADGGLTRYTEQGFAPIAFDKHTLDKFIGLLRQDSKGNIWLGSNNGVYCFNGQKFTYFGLNTANDGNYNPIYGFNPYNNINAMLIDHADSVWIATQNGVYVLEPQKSTFRLVGSKRFFGTVTQMAEDNSGNLWMLRSEGGLLRFDGKQVMQFDERDGLTSSSIQSITLNGNYAWLGMANGIDRFDVHLFNQIQKTQILHLGKPDGFTSPECTYLSYTDPNGNVWVGTKNGITQYNPNLQTQAPNDKLNLRITEVKLRYETVDWIAYTDSLNPRTQLPENLQLHYNENTLTFYFDALLFSNPQHISYQYRLSGQDTAWQPAPPEQMTTYSNLPPGTYHFSVRARHLQQPEVFAQTHFDFTITPPAWHNWWFWAWITTALLLGMVILALLRFIAAQLYKRRMLQRAIEKVTEQTQ